MRPSAETVISALYRNPGEPKSVLWHFLVNDLLSGHFIPARVRTQLLRDVVHFPISNTCVIGPKCFFRDNAIWVGRRSTINLGCVFDNRGGVVIGEDVGIGIGARFITSTHTFEVPERRAGAGSSLLIRVGRGAFLGSYCTLLAGVDVGEGAVIAAGSVVTGHCDSNALYAGIPARKVKGL